LDAIYQNSDVLNRLINEGNIGLIGALYDIETAEVAFQNDLYAGK